MSYILDALRKADAERLRGSIPGLHTHTPTVAPPPVEPATRSRRMTWIAAGLAMALMLMIAWVMLRSAPAPEPAVPPRAAEAPPVAAAPTQAPMTPNAPPTWAGQAPPPAYAPYPRTQQPAREYAGSTGGAWPTAPQQGQDAPFSMREPDDAPPPPVTTRPIPDSRNRETYAPPPVARNTAPPPAAYSEPAAAPPVSEGRVYKVDDLPLEVRAELPKLDINGGMYSEQAADRVLIINGQVVNEGGRIGPDLKLIKINVKTAVVEFRGYRYRVNY